jgi:hypothetical protein
LQPDAKEFSLPREQSQLFEDGCRDGQSFRPCFAMATPEGFTVYPSDLNRRTLP